MEQGNGTTGAHADGRMGQWASGLSDGVVVTIEIRRWRGVTVSLDGIVPTGKSRVIERKVNALLSGLLPREIDMKLRTAETQARSNLMSHSFPCDAFDHVRGRFVPSGVYMDFAVRNEKYRREYAEAARMLEENYDAVAGGVIAGITGIVARECGAGSGSIVDAIVRMLPSHADIAGAMSYTTKTRRVSRGITDSIASMSARQCRAGGISLASIPTACLKAGGHEVTLEDTRMTMARDVKATMHNADLDRQSNAFMLDSAVQLRAMLAEGCTRIVTSMDRNSGTLVGRSSIMAHNMVTTLRAMDYYGDADMQYVLDAISYELDGRPTRDKALLRLSFAKGAEWARASISYLNGVTQRKPQVPTGIGQDANGANDSPFATGGHGADDGRERDAHTDGKASGTGAHAERRRDEAKGGTIVIPQRGKARH